MKLAPDRFKPKVSKLNCVSRYYSYNTSGSASLKSLSFCITFRTSQLYNVPPQRVWLSNCQAWNRVIGVAFLVRKKVRFLTISQLPESQWVRFASQVVGNFQGLWTKSESLSIQVNALKQYFPGAVQFFRDIVQIKRIWGFLPCFHLAHSE